MKNLSNVQAINKTAIVCIACILLLTVSSPTNAIAKKHSVTLNTVFQGIWGITLAKYNGRLDVVFGLVVSGRPSRILGVESMVGLFINTIPVRVRFEETTTFKDLLHKIQEEAVNSLPYHYSLLADIQSRSPLKQDLIDHVLIFENLPLPERIDGLMENSKRNNKGVNLEISKVETVEQARQALDGGADILLLDNMSTDDMSAVVEMTQGRALLEASGGVTLDTVRAIAETGVDRISVGALTHSVKALDISLEIEI